MRRVSGCLRAPAIAAVLLAAATQTVFPQSTTSGCPLCEEGRALISRFDLRPAAQPMRDRAGWSPPVRIVTTIGGDSLAGVLRSIAPSAEVILASLPDAREAVAGADVFIGICTQEIVEAGVALKWIQLPTAGAESCAELPGLAERGVLVTNAQRIYSPSIAEHAMALLFSLTRKLNVYHTLQLEGDWATRTGHPHSATARTLSEVDGRTLLVVGLGGIGTEVARSAHALGMRVIATRNSSREGPDYVEYVGLAHELRDLANQADVVVSAVPLTSETRGMFDAAFFAAMRPGAIFINVGRGESVVTNDLVAALRENRIGGAGLDVTDPEPLPPEHPLWQMPNVIITPHVAGSSDRLLQRLRTLIAENVRRYVAGDRMLSVVDLERGY